MRKAGYDVHAAGEAGQRTDDRELIAQSHREDRVLITEDKDFGWLVFASHVDSSGVILIRFPANARRALGDTVTGLVESHADQLVGAFVVVEPGRTRISRTPARGECQ